MVERPERRSVDGVSARLGGTREPTLVIVHGAGGNMDTTGAFADALGHRAFASVSLPGRDDSPGPPLDRAEALGAWLEGAIEKLGIGAHVALGYSMGGAVAIEYALRQPATLRGLALVSSGARLRVHPQILESFRQASETGIKAKPAHLMYQSDTDPALIARIDDAAARTPPASAYADWLAADRFDRLGQLGSPGPQGQGIQVPTHIVVGSLDPLTPPKYARYLARAIDGATLTELPNAGHYAISERATEVAASVEAFIETRCGG